MMEVVPKAANDKMNVSMITEYEVSNMLTLCVCYRERGQSLGFSTLILILGPT